MENEIENRKLEIGNSISIQSSILVGAIIIALSIVYAFGPHSQANNQSNATTNFKLTERKDAPALGSSSSKVTIIEFADFQCPYCKQFWNDTYNQIKTQYVDTGKVRFVFMHFPLSIHVNAEKSAEAAECANRQGKFWPYYNVLFSKSQSDGTNLDTSSLKSYALAAGLDMQKFNSCLDGGETASVVSSDRSAGIAAQVSGTPTFFINGKQIVGAEPFSVFQSAIDSALKTGN